MNIEFKIGKNEYSIGELTINQYYKIQNLLVTEGMKAKLQIVSHLSGATTKELESLDNYQFLALWQSVIEGPLNHTDDPALFKHIILKEKLYGFMEFSKMTIGEFADMEVLKQDPQKQAKLHVMMAVLYRPATQLVGEWIVTEPYDGDSVMERAEIFKDMPLKYVYGALSFFLQVQKTLLNIMLDSLTSQMTEKEMEKLTPHQRDLLNLVTQFILELQEIGLTPSTSSQTMILPSSEKLQELAQLVSSTTLPTEKTKSKKKTQLGRWLSSKIKTGNK
jgi:hypothetical protein